MSTSRAKKWAIGIGGFVGLVIWVFDYDFFFNVGGPATPISHAIMRVFHLQGAEYPFPLLVPFLMLVGAGVGIGAVAAKLMSRSSA